jgi:membrane-associated protease RseP (regulator of RpoE activity)
VLFTITLIIGTPQALSAQQESMAKDAHVVIEAVLPTYPAAKAGLMEGDEILSTTIREGDVGIAYSQNNPEGVATLISTDKSNDPIYFSINRNGKTMQIIVTPKEGVIPNSPQQPAVGFSLTALGTVKTPVLKAPLEGIIYTWNVIKETAIGLWNLIKGIFTFSADLSQVSGPIGIAHFN